MYEWHLQHYKPGLECSPSMPHSKHNWEKSAVRPDGKYNRSQKWLAREFRLLRSTRIGFFIIHQNVLLIIICRFRLGCKGTSWKACGQKPHLEFQFLLPSQHLGWQTFYSKEFPHPTCMSYSYIVSIHTYTHTHTHIWDHTHIYIYIYIYHAHTHIYVYIHIHVYTAPNMLKEKGIYIPHLEKRHLGPRLPTISHGPGQPGAARWQGLSWETWVATLKLVRGLEHFLFFHIVGIIIPTD